MAQSATASALSTIETRTHLVRKLARWITTAKTEEATDLGNRCAVARACVEQPDWAFHCGVPALLRRAAHVQQETSEPFPEADVDKPRLYRDDLFTIYELLTQRHLVEEANICGNCLAAECDYFGDDGSEPLMGGLIYWHKMKKGESRLFSIRWTDTDSIFATAEYTYKYKAITTIEFYGECPTFCMRDGISALIKALKISLPDLKLRFILLPEFQYLDGVLTRDGEWRPFDPDKREYLLAGGISIPPNTRMPVVHGLVRMPGVSVSFEHPETVDLVAQLTGDIYCRELYSRHDVWPEGVIDIVGTAAFPFVTQARFPRLRNVCGDVTLKRLVKGDFPVLLNLRGRLDIRAAEQVSFPALENVEGKLSLTSWDKRSFPKLAAGENRIGSYL